MTICCKQRGTNRLCTGQTGQAILETVRFYRQQKWFPHLFLLMPDPVHAIVNFGRGQRIEAVMSAWKRYAASKHGIGWQQGFFEHRLRQHESAEEKAEHIRQNPVRAGLVSTPAEWPFLLRFDDQPASDN